MNKDWFEIDRIVRAIKKDKKQTDNSIKAVLINSEHRLDVYKDIEIKEIKQAVSHMILVLE